MTLMNSSPNPNLGKEVHMTSAKQLRSRVRRNSQARFCRRGWEGDFPLDSTKLSDDRRYLTFSDKFQAGIFKLWGSRNLHFYQLEQIKRVRVIRKHDGYYAQFLIDHEREEKKELTGKQTGLDVGLNYFYTDCCGNQADNPRFLRKDERQLKKLQRRLSRTKKGSQNRKKARNRLGRAHLKVSRRRQNRVCKLAQHVIRSNDLVAIENLRIRNMVKNHRLAKSINDAARVSVSRMVGVFWESLWGSGDCR